MVTQLEPARTAAVRGNRRAHMGYQPALDGLRGLSLAAVVAYHAHVLGVPGLGAFGGGFLGVEVFFVVSGYLITRLLLEEHGAGGGIDLRRFWLRRARRLLPALAVMLATVALWAGLFRGDTLARFRHDLFGAVFYVANWQQVAGGAGYFAALETPPLLRHLWSLAVEEQWYLLWPPAVALLLRRTRGDLRPVRLVIGGAAAVSALAMALVYGPTPFRTNLAYLSTFTRVAGLLLGALLATGWAPWSWRGASRRHLRALDLTGFGALAGLAAAMVLLSSHDAALYRGGMLAVSALSVVAIAAAVHPGAHWLGRALSHPTLAALGRRSYGLYLWHWPVFVLLSVGDGWLRLVPALAVTAALSEACFRLVERPVRAGALGRWWRQLQAPPSPRRRRAMVAAVVPALLLIPVGLRVATADPVDAAADTSADVAFDAAAATTSVPGEQPATTGAPAPDPTAAAAPAAAAQPTTTVDPGPAPTRVVLVGDSQAHSLYVNQPSGVEKVLALSDGAVEGCGLFDSGSLQSSIDWSRSVSGCAGWNTKWAAAALNAKAQVALVTIGAWDVFDLRKTTAWLVFGSEPHDAELKAKLAEGIAALKGVGTRVALLEVPCMRPIDVDGNPVPKLPERGQDRRVQHLNDLLKAAAAADPDNVSFLPGPTEWCQDPAVANDTSYRWDGVHVFKPGAKLVFDTIAARLAELGGPG